ncbi:MAG: hypothetical protein Q4G01_03550 [Eubacteriales bacterium]|nr:hypothetical protein [Eubacteriales bacterium]
MKNRRNVSNKTVAILLALVLAIGCAVGGTLAWLISKTEPVVNTFTYGDINIDLYEHEYNASENNLEKSKVKSVDNYKIIPGVDLPKDPTVEVKANSEACWLFVKVKEENWPTFTDADKTKKVSYHIADGWAALDSQPGVYYREVDAAAAKAGESYYILKGNTTYANGVVTVSENLTKTEVDQLKKNSPTLTFKAYAVQKDGIKDADAAWKQIADSTTTKP